MEGGEEEEEEGRNHMEQEGGRRREGREPGEKGKERGAGPPPRPGSLRRAVMAPEGLSGYGGMGVAQTCCPLSRGPVFSPCFPCAFPGTLSTNPPVENFSLIISPPPPPLASFQLLFQGRKKQQLSRSHVS